MATFVTEALMELVASHLVPALLSEATSLAVRYASRSADERPHPRHGRVLSLVPSTAVLSATPGRLRLRVEGLRGNGGRAVQLEHGLRLLPGIHRVTASSVTGTVLVHYDPARTSVARIRAVLEPREVVTIRQVQREMLSDPAGLVNGADGPARTLPGHRARGYRLTNTTTCRRGACGQAYAWQLPLHGL